MSYFNQDLNKKLLNSNINNDKDSDLELEKEKGKEIIKSIKSNNKDNINTPDNLDEKNPTNLITILISNEFEDLYNILNYKFKDEKIIRQALTRQSAIGERIPKASDSNYQRLEYFW
jgi:hypothetical protein